jgi:hypothetical protein
MDQLAPVADQLAPVIELIRLAIKYGQLRHAPVRRTHLIKNSDFYIREMEAITVMNLPSQEKDDRLADLLLYR